VGILIGTPQIWKQSRKWGIYYIYTELTLSSAADQAFAGLYSTRFHRPVSLVYVKYKPTIYYYLFSTIYL